MKSLLVQHAIDNIWCEPIQDRQHFIEPARITTNSGSYKHTKVLWETVPLPNANNDADRSYFHVYQLGQLKEQTFFGLVLEKNRWVDLNSLAEAYGMSIDVYLGNGIIIPRSHCFLRFNKDENMILAIRIVHTLDLGKESIYNALTGTSTLRKVTLSNNAVRIRFYKNARFQSVDWRNTATDTLYPIRSRSSLLTNNGVYNTFMSQCAAIETRYVSTGMGYWYLDGVLISKPAGWKTDFTNKTLTFVWDSSIKGKFTFSMKNIPVFTSKVDNKTKYILLLNTSYTTIDYHDDHDIYVTVQTETGHFKGLYVDRMNTNIVSMLTHNAYALDTDAINKLLVNHEDFKYIDKCSIHLIARQGGIYKGLTVTHNRIEELYRLPRNKIVEALTGVNSSLPEWSARELEISAYTKIMGAKYEEITQPLAEEAYGYNATTLNIAPVFHEPQNINGQSFVKVPENLLLKNPKTGLCERVVFAYRDGILRKAISDQSSNDHIVLSTSEMYDAAELLHGDLSDGYIKFYHFETPNATTVIDEELPYWEFRIYACGRNDQNQLSNDWRDITDMKYHTYLPNGDASSQFKPCIKWDVVKLQQANIVPKVRISDSIHFYQPLAGTNINNLPGYISFNLTYRKDKFSNTRSTMDIAPGVIDVFMNGKSLVPNIDYFINFPRVVIVKEYTALTSGNDIQVRYYGSANPETNKPYEVRDFGFVKDGVLSADGEYDTRYDRNIRVNVGGNIVNKNRYVFAERNVGERAPDGLPWSVTDYMVQVESFTDKTTLEYAKISRELDDRIERYLTHHLGEVPTPRPTVVGERWRLYSPFMSAIIHLMAIEGYPPDLIIGTTFDTQKINQWLSGWLFLLDFDPALKDLDMNYIEISPHPYLNPRQVTSNQYSLLRYIAKTYLNDKVSLSRFLTIQL